MTHIDRRADEVQTALDHVGVAKRHQLIVDNATGSLTRPTPACLDPLLYGPDADAKRGSQKLGAPEQVLSLLGQLETRHACHELILREEARSRDAFDVVLLTRPDIAWPQPVHPYCAYDLKRPAKKRDWVFFMPRADAKYMMSGLHDRLLRCDAPYQPTKPVENWVYDQLAQGAHNFSDIQFKLSGVVVRPDRAEMPRVWCSTLDNSLGGRGGTCARVTRRSPCFRGQ